MKHIQLLQEKIVDCCGILVSLLCLVHCLALPFAFAFFPNSGELAQPWGTHSVLATFVLLFAVYSIWRGFLHHGSKTPMVLAVIGGGLVAFALTIAPEHSHVHFEIDAHSSLTILGSIFLVLSHAVNLKHCSSCNCVSANQKLA